MNFSDIYTNPNVPDMGFDIDLKYDLDRAPAFDWTAGDEKPEKSFLDNFKSALEKSGSYLGKTQQDTRKYDIYGDRRRSGGDTVADLGGGNTLSAPDSALATQLQMQALQQQGQQGGVGRMAGSVLGQAGGAALGGSAALAGTALGSVLGPIGAIAGGALGGLLPF